MDLVLKLEKLTEFESWPLELQRVCVALFLSRCPSDRPTPTTSAPTPPTAPAITAKPTAPAQLALELRTNRKWSAPERELLHACFAGGRRDFARIATQFNRNKNAIEAQFYKWRLTTERPTETARNEG
jgi:hypothetical protein